MRKEWEEERRSTMKGGVGRRKRRGKGRTGGGKNGVEDGEREKWGTGEETEKEREEKAQEEEEAQSIRIGDGQPLRFCSEHFLPTSTEFSSLSTEHKSLW